MIKAYSYRPVAEDCLLDLSVLAADYDLPATLNWVYYSPARHEFEGLPSVKAWVRRTSATSWEVVTQEEAVQDEENLIVFAY